MIIIKSIWGPICWKFIHLIALSYPLNPTDNDKTNYRLFYESLAHILPCQQCNEHYKQHIYNNPLTNDVLLNNETLLKWTIDIHNIVNKDNNKPIYNYYKANQLIMDSIINENKLNCNEYIKKSNYYFYFILFLIFLIFLIFLYYFIVVKSLFKCVK